MGSVHGMLVLARHTGLIKSVVLFRLVVSLRHLSVFNLLLGPCVFNKRVKDRVAPK